MRNEIPLSQFLEEETEGQTLYHNYCIKENILSKSGRLLDIITPQAISSNCFTKSYGRYVEGSGSVLETCPLVAPSRAFDEQTGEWNQEILLEELRARKLRYFSPREMLNLHGFPSSYQFPSSITTLQAYKLIGNSLNVVVVRELLRYLMGETS